MNIPYWLKNWRAEISGRTWHLLQRLQGRMVSTLSAVAVYPDGRVINYGIVSRRCVTTAGVNALASTSIPKGITAFNYHDSGTGTNAESIADTGLQTPAGPARVAGTQSNPSPGNYQSQATITYTATQDITEHGIFDASTNGTLLDRSVKAPIGVVPGLSIIWTYNNIDGAGG